MSNNLGTSNRSQLAYKLEGIYPTNFGVPQVGNGALLNMTSESLNYDVKNENSKQLRQDRLTPDIVQVGASASGGFGFEHQYAEYDPFLEAIVQGVWSAFGTDGIGAAGAGTLTPTAPTVLTASVAPTGTSALTNLKKGQWFSITPHSSASNAVKRYLASRAFRVSPATAPTTTVLTLDSSTPVNTTIVTAALAAGWKISSSSVANGNVARSYTLEVQHTDVTQFRVYSGMVPSKMDVKLSVGSIVTGNFEFMGKSMDLVQATAMGTAAPAQSFTPANATRGVFDVIEDGALISATTYIKSADISIDNKLRIQDAVGVFGAAGIGSGTMEIMIKGEFYFANQTLYNKFLSGAASSISIPILDVDGNGYVYHFPRIKYTAAKVNAGGQDQDLTLSVDAMALPDITAGSDTLGKAVVVYRVGAGVAVVAAGSNLQPRFGYGLPNAAGDDAAFDTIFAAMTNLTGSVSGGRTGSFNTVSSVTNYTWVAVLASAAGATLRFNDGTGFGGFSGAAAAGLYVGSDQDPVSTAFLTYTDAGGNVWNMYRSNDKANTFNGYSIQ